MPKTKFDCHDDDDDNGVPADETADGTAPDVQTNMDMRAARTGAATSLTAARADAEADAGKMSQAEIREWINRYEKTKGLDEDARAIYTYVNPKHKDPAFDYMWAKNTSFEHTKMLANGWKIVHNTELAREKGNRVSSIVQIASDSGESGQAALVLYHRPKQISQIETADRKKRLETVGLDAAGEKGVSVNTSRSQQEINITE